MARIPEAQRRTFASGIVRPTGGVDLGAIGRAAAPFQSLSRNLQTVQNVLVQKREQQLVAESAEFNSRMSLQFQEQFTNSLKSRQLQSNPTLARGEVNRIAAELTSSPEFTQQPLLVQNLARRNIARLRQSFGSKAINFENEQTFRNTVTALNKTQSNFEVEALTTDTDLNELLKRYTATVAGSTKSGALTLAQGEKQVTSASKAIVSNRVQRLINEKDLDGARTLINDPTIQEHLGADGIQRAINTIERKEQLALNRAVKLQKLKGTNPWKFIANVDSEEIPPLDLSNPSNLPDTLDDRIDYVNRKKEEHGILDLPVLTDQEQEVLLKTFDNVSPDNGSQIMNQLTANLTDEGQDLISEQIFKKRPTLGVAIAVADEDPNLSQALLNGEKVRKQKLIQMPSDNDLIAEVNDRIGQAIQQPGLRNAAHEAVRSIYADQVFRDNDNSGVIQSDIVEQALDRLFGPVIEINDAEVIGFRKVDGQFIDEDEFEDLFEDLSEGQLRSSLGDVPRDVAGEPLPLGDLKDEANLVVIGNGQYIIQLFTEFAVDKDGQPYILDMKKLSDEREGILDIIEER